MVALSRIAAALFVLAIPVFLVTANIRFLASDTGFYERGLRKHGSAEATGLPLAELDRAAGDIVEYFENDAETLRILVIEDGQEVSLFDARETEHMRDVKSLMRAVYRLSEVSLAFILLYVGGVVLWSGERTVRGLAKLSLAGVGTGLLLVAVVGMFAITGFDEMWTRFHKIVFNNNLWLLDPDTDSLIQMFPEPFWEEATFIAGGLILGEALAIVAVSAAYLALSRGRRNRGEVTSPRAVGPGRVQEAD